MRRIERRLGNTAPVPVSPLAQTPAESPAAANWRDGSVAEAVRQGIRRLAARPGAHGMDLRR
jgi:hypothetical protein